MEIKFEITGEAIKEAREQEKRAKKLERPQTSNEILGLKSIAEMQKLGLGEMFRQQLTLAWYFQAWYEKLILVGLCILGVWKIVGWIW